MRTPSHPLPGRGRLFLATLGLAALVLSIYAQTFSFPFVNYDDEPLIAANPALRDGLTLDSFRWAFTSDQDAGWIPLTWISRLVDVSLFGMDARWHHAVNVLLHATNVLLLFLALRRATGSLHRSLFVAALFATHPLHVESVAWVTERKDVLFLFFWLAGMHGYLSYVRRPGAFRYLGFAVLFVLSTMSKPMAVTFPFALLLFDLWPLGRRDPRSAPPGGRFRSRFPRILAEKVPLFLVSAAVAAATIRFQSEIGALTPLDEIPLSARVGNALLSYASYLRKAFWPSGLSVFYPHPGSSIPWLRSGLSLLVLSSLSAFAIAQFRDRPWIPFGWFWFLGTMLPVIGLVQAGGPAMADRFFYLPGIGLYVLVSWGFREAAERFALLRRAFPIAAASSILLLTAISHRQASLWSGSIPLFRHAIGVTSENWVAHANLGHALEREGRLEEAIRELREAVRIHPGQPEARITLGVCLARTGRLEEAASQYREAIRIAPESAVAWNNLGAALAGMGRYDEAARSYGQAISIDPGYEEPRRNLSELRGTDVRTR